MIITLISEEKNLGLVTLTDHLLDKLGRGDTKVFGWNYLIADNTKLINQINEDAKDKKILIKYVIPKLKFSNQVIAYPPELDKLSDVLFKVPNYREEISRNLVLKFYKGDKENISEYIKQFYK